MPFPVLASCRDLQAGSLRSPARRQPLQRVLEKGVLERRLERAGVGVADSKLRTDFELRGAMDFHIELAVSGQRTAHCLQCELGCVAIAAEMAEHDALDSSRQQLFDHVGRRCVRQMTMPRLNPLFHRPRPMRVVLQKFFVVIGLDHERLHLAQAFDDQFSHVTEIGNEPKAA